MLFLALQLRLLLAFDDNLGIAHFDLLLILLDHHLFLELLSLATSYLPNDNPDNFNHQEDHVDKDVESYAGDQEPTHFNLPFKVSYPVCEREKGIGRYQNNHFVKDLCCCARK